jgi:hypothetical protein
VTTRTRTAIEIAVILLIAAVVDVVPGAGNAARALEAAIWLLFGAGILWVLVRAYREHRLGLYGLGDGRRALLYGAIAVGALVLAARARMWQWGVGELAFWVLLGLVAYTLFALYRFAKRY